MPLVYAGVCSHAPGITGRAHLADPAQRDAVHAAFDQMRIDIEATKPDAIMVMAAEHFANFFMNNMPSFAVGMPCRRHCFRRIARRLKLRPKGV